MFTLRNIEQMTQQLVSLEHEIADLRAQQVVLVNELDSSQAPMVDASRSLTEYVQSRTDVSDNTARDLVFLARTIPHHRSVSLRLSSASITFDRAVAATKYSAAGASDTALQESFERDLHTVARLTRTRRHTTSVTERDSHDRRYFTSQPNLDRSVFRFWGELPGADGHVVEKALHERSDELRRESPDVESSRGQRQADAVVAMAMDSLDRNEEDVSKARNPHVTVFVDARNENATETSAEIEYGPNVGPATLEEILCSGSVRVLGMDGAIPVSTSAARRRIPPAIRDSVAARDGGCTIDGCRSRYRLEPHHIEPFAHGGSHDVGNLTTLCWYHHHVAIHRSGYRIDYDTPPHRRRLIRPQQPTGHDPP